MTVANQTIDVFRGDSRLVLVTLTNADDGTPFDPTAPGIDIQWRMAQSLYGLDGPTVLDPGPLLAKSLGSGIVPSPGQISITLTPQDTDIEAREYIHALRIYEGGDVASTMIGTFLVRPMRAMGRLPGGASGIKAAQLALSATVPSRVHT